MKKYSKLIIVAFVALIFIGTFVFLYIKSQPEPVVYNEFTPKTADISKTTLITGKIEPRNEVNVKPQIYGAQNEAYKGERGRKTPKAVYLQRVARVEGVRAAQNETFT